MYFFRLLQNIYKNYTNIYKLGFQLFPIPGHNQTWGQCVISRTVKGHQVLSSNVDTSLEDWILVVVNLGSQYKNC
jgi:hypothetical protein